MRLNLGCGKLELDGYTNIDIANGDAAYPLPDIESGTCDEVRASHLLEHFRQEEVAAVLGEWVRVLKPGGVLKVAVPDFAKVAALYQADVSGLPLEGYIMGGQTDDNDYHHTIWDTDKLRVAMMDAGLIRIERWESDAEDCASLPISLNMQAVKPTADMAKPLNVQGCMSVPRLGFMDNFFCAMEACVMTGVQLRKATGAFWGQCLERIMVDSINEGADIIITVDYDTIFEARDIQELVYLMRSYPEADAIAAMQAPRGWRGILAGVDAAANGEVNADYFSGDLARARTAHFGLTAIRVESLQKMAHPWFMGHPDGNGEWGPGRTDDDIHFWQKWRETGNSLYLAPRVTVGHLELTIRWPDKQLNTLFQPVQDYHDNHKPPAEVWR